MTWLFVVVSHPSRRTLLERLLDSIRGVEGEIRLVWQASTAPEKLQAYLPLRLIHADTRCLSCSRNLALDALEHFDVVAFPDDDAWYPKETLAEVEAIVQGDPEVQGVVGQLVTPEGRSTGNRYPPGPVEVTSRNVWRVVSASTLFVRGAVVRSLGGFREDLGLGAESPYPSAEDAEWVLRMLRHRMNVVYLPHIRVYHKWTEDPRVLTAQRYRMYGRGMGRVLRLYRAPWWEVGVHLIRPLGGALLALLRGDPRRARVRWAGARGRWEGWTGRCS
ncbi:MAG: hypothetical protein L3J76_03430 [Candidatus Hydrothermae bacterium]|nr:hypothetical protein [Candidatus Hydrothermae bacterium]